MKIIKQEGSDERTILIGMIVDSAICGRLCSKWTRGGLFRSKWSNLIASWCIKHYERYEKALGQKIENKFERWAQRSKDQATIDIVEGFLSDLSDEWKQLKRDSNSDYVLDLASKYFALVQTEQFREELDTAIENKNPDEAVKLISSFSCINIGQGEWINPFKDEAAIRSAFTNNRKPLITYPGALGVFFGDRLERDGLICIEGPEKRGKTFWLMDMVFRGVLQRRRVAYFQAGDMSRDQIMRRLMVRVSGIPIKPETIKIPRKISFSNTVDDKGKPIKKASVRGRKKEFKKGLTWRRALKACDDFQRKQIKSLEDYIRLSVYPMESLSVPVIKSLLTEWSREGWIVDIVVIDYADILDMDCYKGIEGRDKINKTWKQLRNLSQVFHCLVITGSQSDAKGGDVRTLGRSHFSEDKRKRAHVTGTIGLNQTEIEKKQDIMRLNWIVLREDKYLQSRCVWVAGCPELANLAIKSSF